MTEVHVSPALAVAKDLLSGNPDGLKELVRAVLQEVFEAEMTEVSTAPENPARRRTKTRPGGARKVCHGAS